MISWLQSTFKKHYQLIFFLMLCALIVPFVFTIGATPGIGPAGTKTLEQPFFGYNLSRNEDQRRIFGDASYSVMLKAGYPALQGAQLQEYALQRVAGLALADQLRLPAATEAQVSEYVSKLAVFQDENGRFDAQRYARFGDSLKGNPQFTTADAGRVLRVDARLDLLQKLLGGPGYVLPREVREQLVRAESTWTLQVASLDYAKFDAGVTVTDDALARFFEENSFRYQVPQRFRLSLVEFKATDFSPTGEPSEEQLRNYYNANPARFPAPADAAKKDAPAVSLDPTAPAAATDDFAKVRDQVLAALKQEAALANASKAASDFTIALYEGKVAANSPQLDAALAARRLTAAPLPPLNPDEPPANLEWIAGQSSQVARLDANRHFTDALRTPTGFAVLLWHESVPPYQPMLAEVREKVAVDYRESEKRKRFIERGKALKERLADAVKAGTAFEKAAADAGLEVATHANFTLREPPQGVPFPVFSAIEGLRAGQFTDMVVTADKGLLAFVQSKAEPDLSESGTRYAEVRAQLARFNAGATGNAVLSEMVEEELKKTAPADAGTAP